MRHSVQRIVDDLVAKWQYYPILSSDPNRLRRCVERGEPIPDSLLPGRAIQSMSKDDRELLASATSRNFNHRIFG